MAFMLLFGPGYTGSRIADALRADGWEVATAGRAAAPDAVHAAIERASHILSCVPPEAEADPVLAAYGEPIVHGPARWLGYLSSTGVYGDSKGGWVDESAPPAGRRGGRIAADVAWLERGARVLRLPGIYGPGRSALDRVMAGTAHRIDLPGQVFSRIHVDDIVSAVLAAIAQGPAGAYNIADDCPAPQNAVIEAACALLGAPVPALLSLDSAGLSPAARAFYGENRRVANGKAKRLLGWRPRFPDYRAGLRALIASTSPTSTSAPPMSASADQR